MSTNVNAKPQPQPTRTSRQAQPAPQPEPTDMFDDVPEEQFEDVADESVDDSQYDAAAPWDDEPGEPVADFTDLPEFEPLPNGIHTAIVDEVILGPSKSSGSQMYTITYRILDGEWANRTVKDYASFSEKAKGITYRKLEQLLGRPIPRGPYYATRDDRDALEGRVVRIRTKLEPGNDGITLWPKVTAIMQHRGEDEETGTRRSAF